MLHVKLLVRIPHARSHSVTADFLKGQRRHKLLCMLSHNHTHLAACLTQTAHQVNSLINGDTTGYAQNNLLTL